MSARAASARAASRHQSVSAARRQRHARRIKRRGYEVSTVSVLLLAVPAWNNASTSPWLMACLILGMAASIVGMMLRWWSYRTEHEQD